MASFLSGVEMKEEAHECEEYKRKGTVRNHWKQGLTDFSLMKLKVTTDWQGSSRKIMFNVAVKYVESMSFEGVELFTHLELYYYCTLFIRVITLAPTF